MWLISFHKTLTHIHTPSLLPPWIIPVSLLSYDTLEKLSNPWAPETTSHFERGHQRGQHRECPAILQVCWGGGGFMCVTLVTEVAGGIHGEWGREMDRLCALVREWAECQFVSLPCILQAWHCESDQAVLPLNSCVCWWGGVHTCGLMGVHMFWASSLKSAFNYLDGIGES